MRHRWSLKVGRCGMFDPLKDGGQGRENITLRVEKTSMLRLQCASLPSFGPAPQAACCAFWAPRKMHLFFFVGPWQNASHVRCSVPGGGCRNAFFSRCKMHGADPDTREARQHCPRRAFVHFSGAVKCIRPLPELFREERLYKRTLKGSVTDRCYL